MTVKLFVGLYVGLIVGMFVLMFANFWVGWIFFGFVFVATFGGMMVSDRPQLIAAAFLLVALVVLGIGLWGIWPLGQIRAWPTARGVVTRSWVCGSDRLCIEYRYTVNDDQTYAASTQDTGELVQSWGGIPARYQEDRVVQIYYDPGNPGNSRVTADISIRDGVTLTVGGLMAALAAGTLFQVLRERKRTPKTAAPVIKWPQGLSEEAFRKAYPRRRAAGRRQPPVTADQIEKLTEMYKQVEAFQQADPRRHVADLPQPPDMAAQLEKLEELHRQHALTDEAYAAAKRKLLG